MTIWAKLLCIFLSLFFLWLAGLIGFVGYSLSLQPENPQQKTDTIVVLTGGNQRIETGLALFAAGRSSNLFITGVNEQVTKDDITAMWTGKNSLPRCCITLGYQARSTIQNAAEARDWIKSQEYSSIRLVTANYHMPRAKMELSAALPDMDIVIHPVNQRNFDYKTRWFWIVMFSEYHKTIYRIINIYVYPVEGLINKLVKDLA